MTIENKLPEEFRFRTFDAFGEPEEKWLYFRRISSPKGILIKLCKFPCPRCEVDTKVLAFTVLPKSEIKGGQHNVPEILELGSSVSHVSEIPREVVDVVRGAFPFYKEVQDRTTGRPTYSNHCLICGVKIDDLHLHHGDGPFSQIGFGSVIRMQSSLISKGAGVDPNDGLSPVLKIFWLDEEVELVGVIGALDVNAFDDFEIRRIRDGGHAPHP